MSREQVSIVARPVMAVWEPKPDITAFELARCMPLIPAVMAHTSFMPQEWHGMATEIRRHFRAL